MMDTKYLLNLQDHIDKQIKPVEIIEIVDSNLLKSVSTCYRRGRKLVRVDDIK